MRTLGQTLGPHLMAIPGDILRGATATQCRDQWRIDPSCGLAAQTTLTDSLTAVSSLPDGSAMRCG